LDKTQESINEVLELGKNNNFLQLQAAIDMKANTTRCQDVSSSLAVLRPAILALRRPMILPQPISASDSGRFSWAKRVERNDVILTGPSSHSNFMSMAAFTTQPTNTTIGLQATMAGGGPRHTIPAVQRVLNLGLDHIGSGGSSSAYTGSESECDVNDGHLPLPLSL